MRPRLALLAERPPAADPAPRALGYVRRSEATEATQRKRGGQVVSLDVQAEAITRACQEQGWTLAALIPEDGVSGGRRDRLLRLSRALRAHRATILVCYHQDRLARDLAGLLDHVRDWAKHGVRVWIVGRGWLELDSAAGYLAGAVEGMVAEHYRLVIAEKTQDAMHRLAEARARFTRLPPFGFCWEPDGVHPPGHPRAGQPRYVMAEAPQEQATLATLRALAPGRSLRALGAALRAAGHRPRSGGVWQPSVLRALLRRG